ncbi:MAG: hypothetical protein ACTHU0_14000 [Kofleriaceae bacterium]
METAQFHVMADLGWLELTMPYATRAQYIRQLTAALGFAGPLEAALSLTPGLGALVDLHPRRKSGKIVEDLLALGLGAHQIAMLPQCGGIEPFDDACRGLGWLYVSERASLLHHTVLRQLRTHLPRAATACAYLTSYDGVVRARWEALGAALDRAVTRSEDVDRLVAAAREAFECQNRWFRSERTEERAAASSGWQVR